MERFISLVARLTALISLFLVALVTQPSTCNRDDSEGEEQVDTLSVQLSVTAQATPTPLWAVVWGPTQPLEDETHHFLSSQETDHLHLHGNQQETVDPQFYVTVTISSLLILTAVIITAKLYDRSCSQHPPPLSRGVPPALSLALPRSLASEESRQTLQSTASSSFTDRER
uniref:Si:ch211-154o6.4 n=1 Tax=Acanthochromis polyacanthus TaxID=80966 RepID=A0A3Q1EL77_9TELE